MENVGSFCSRLEILPETTHDAALEVPARSGAYRSMSRVSSGRRTTGNVCVCPTSRTYNAAPGHRAPAIRNEPPRALPVGYGQHSANPRPLHSSLCARRRRRRSASNSPDGIASRHHCAMHRRRCRPGRSGRWCRAPGRILSLTVAASSRSIAKQLSESAQRRPACLICLLVAVSIGVR